MNSSATTSNSTIPVVSLNDLEVGKKLGSGSFSDVYSITVKRGLSEVVKSLSTASSSCSSTVCSSTSSQDSQATTSTSSTTDVEVTLLPADPTTTPLALKRLHEKTLSDPRQTRLAQRDLKTEMEILSRLPSHPHIVQLYGISSANATSNNVFLIQQQLTTTLDAKLEYWRRKHAKQQPSHEQLKLQQTLRLLSVAVDLTSALECLHAHDIVYRDVKPPNVGFDAEGHVRLFDLGFCRDLSTKEPSRPLTMCLGTLPYVAPEVCHTHSYYVGEEDEHADHHRPYGLPVDVYGLGCVLVELMALQKLPMSHKHCRQRRRRPQWTQLSGVFSTKNKNKSRHQQQHTMELFHEHAQHPVQPDQEMMQMVQSPEMRTLIQECLALNPAQRPTMKQVHRRLQTEVQQVLG